MNKKPTVKSWDLPTRLFHWLLVILVANAWVTYAYGDINMQWHMWNGYAVLTLCVYRLLWGLIGSNTARFTNFIKGPVQVIGYIKSLRGKPLPVLGHNPLGGLMVLALLGLLLLQGSMGLFTSDDIFVSGPLTFLVSSSWVDTAGSIHRLGYWFILGFVGVHVSAAIFYLLFKRENLIRPMVTGEKEEEIVPEGQALQARPLWLALLCLCCAGGLVALVVNLSRFI